MQTLTTLPRKYKRALLLIFDISAITISIFLSFSIRLGHFYLPSENSNFLALIFLALLIAIPIFIAFKLYFQVVRYVSFNSIWQLTKAISLYAVLWGLIVFMLALEGIPRSVILINWLLSLTTICGSRLLARWILTEFSSYSDNVYQTCVLIYGAGSAGRQLNDSLREAKDYKPIAFIDDSKELYGQSMNGLFIYSQDKIARLIEKYDIRQVLLAIPSLSRSRRAEIIEFLEPFPIAVRSLPGVSDIIKGKVNINDLLEIDIRDLLGRDSVIANKRLLKTNIFNKIVFVSGAGGSIGSELCRQILTLKPKLLILYEHSESSLYKIEQELNSDITITPVLGSVTNSKLMKKIFADYKVQTIYHAAAYKHVPLVEKNPSQGILNNAIGTMKIAESAISENVETFVLISTDKAVRPTSVMGASKRVAELVLQAFAKEKNNTCFTIVRFGNVLDSSGSVIPLFRKQIKDGGPITVTHPNIVRYFMTIPEAVELVIQAGAMAKGGEVFVLDMGEPIRIYDLAVKMIQLTGLTVLDEDNPNGDIRIEYTGLRPGEKLYEELLVNGNFENTENKLIMRAEEEMITLNILSDLIDQISEASINSDTKKVYELLKIIVPQFKLTKN